jgi:hypothetical protein
MAKIEEELNGKKDAVVFVTSVDAFTKVTGSFFDEGEAIGITALSPINKTNVCYTVKDGALTAADPICWLEDQTDTTRFLAVYPFTSSLNPAQPFTFTANVDQTRGSDSSDLLTAAMTSTKQAGAVRLAFYHRMAKLVISVEGGDASSVTIENVPLAATADIVKGTFTAAGSNGSVKAGKQSDGTWTAIIAPHKGYAGVVKVVSNDGKETVYRPSGDVADLTSGKQATIQLRPVTVDPAKEATYSYSIEEWYDCGVLPYTPGAEGADYAEHNCMLYRANTGDYFDMEYSGNSVWSYTGVFNQNDYFVLYIDNRFWGRGFESNCLQFDGDYNAMRTLYYWMIDYPCKATVTYDMLNEKIHISYEDTWEDAGQVKIEGNLLQGLGVAASSGPVTVPWQKNRYAESVYRAVGPFDYLNGSGTSVNPGHIVLDIAVKANDVENNVSFLKSNTGLLYAFWPEEAPEYLSPVIIYYQSVYGIIEGNVITIPAGSVVVPDFNAPEGTIMNSEVKLTILN